MTYYSDVVFPHFRPFSPLYSTFLPIASGTNTKISRTNQALDKPNCDQGHIGQVGSQGHGAGPAGLPGRMVEHIGDGVLRGMVAPASQDAMTEPGLSADSFFSRPGAGHFNFAL